MSETTRGPAVPPGAPTTFKDLCLDVDDPARMATFWAAALGLSAQQRGDNVLLVGGTPEQAVWLNVVPEPKTVKQRVHLDLHVAAVEPLVDAGATVVDTS